MTYSAKRTRLQDPQCYWIPLRSKSLDTAQDLQYEEKLIFLKSYLLTSQLTLMQARAFQRDVFGHGHFLNLYIRPPHSHFTLKGDLQISPEPFSYQRIPIIKSFPHLPPLQISSRGQPPMYHIIKPHDAVGDVQERDVFGVIALRLVFRAQNQKRAGNVRGACDGKSRV